MKKTDKTRFYIASLNKETYKIEFLSADKFLISEIVAGMTPAAKLKILADMIDGACFQNTKVTYYLTCDK